MSNFKICAGLPPGKGMKDVSWAVSVIGSNNYAFFSFTDGLILIN